MNDHRPSVPASQSTSPASVSEDLQHVGLDRSVPSAFDHVGPGPGAQDLNATHMSTIEECLIAAERSRRGMWPFGLSQACATGDPHERGPELLGVVAWSLDEKEHSKVQSMVPLLQHASQSPREETLGREQWAWGSRRVRVWPLSWCELPCFPAACVTYSTSYSKAVHVGGPLDGIWRDDGHRTR